MLVKATNRTGMLDKVHRAPATRSAPWITEAGTLHAELRQVGFTGSVQTVRRWLHPLAQRQPRVSPAPKPRPEVPKPRQITYDPDHPTRLDRGRDHQPHKTLACCPELQAHAHVRSSPT